MDEGEDFELPDLNDDETKIDIEKDPQLKKALEILDNGQ